MKKFFIFLFSLVFLALSVVWVLFAAELLYPDSLSVFSEWEWFQENIQEKITASYINNPEGYTGFQIVVYSGAAFLIYTSSIFLISKIPVIGEFIKSMTAFIGSLLLILIVVGILLWTGVLPF